MRVVIDGRPLVGNRTGIGVHTAEIARRLPFETVIASHAEISDREGLHRSSFIVHRSSLGVWWQQTKLPRIDGDVLWGPHGTLPLAKTIPSVVTLHDFTSITMPGRHRLKTILSFNLFIGRSLEQASRIEIVPNGVDEFFSPDPAIAEGDYVLFTGTLEPRKGVHDLIAAWRSLPMPRPRLILCGDRGWKMRIPDDSGIEVTGYVTRERLRDLYRGARAFVYPSRYEGFGIPPLEAMACGAPVIATRTGAIPEFAEGAALFVDAGDVDGLRAALVRMLRDATLRRELRERGPEQARLWTWDRGARAMSELLRCA